MVRRGTCATMIQPSMVFSDLSDKDLMNWYQQAEAILMEDVPSLIMYTQVQKSRLIKGYVKSFKPAITANIDWDQLWLNKIKKVKVYCRRFIVGV